MLDEHIKLDGFGIMPTVFGISTYSILVGLGLIVGLIYYLVDAKKRQAQNEHAIEIVGAAFLFGFIGAKVPLILECLPLENIIFGKSIVGALLGGMLGVIVIKRIRGIKDRMGNIIAPAIALGMAIGRLGCFFNGCCYGKPASWGVDFGDGILRYPTQLFEVAFHLIAFVILHNLKSRVKRPGILFQYYVMAYLVFRFLIEFIRENKVIMFNLTVYQLLCLGGILLISLRLILSERKVENERKQAG